LQALYAKKNLEFIEMFTFAECACKGFFILKKKDGILRG